MSITSLYTQFVSNVLFPSHELLKGHDTVRVRRELERTQWWSRDKLEELQINRLRNLLIHAEKYVPYYRSLFNNTGFRADEVKSLVDLRSLPFLTKEKVRSYLDSIRSTTAAKVIEVATGGSSGEPLRFFVGKERISHDVAAKWRATRWWDVDIGDREVVVWGSPIELGTQDCVRKFRDSIIRTRLLPAFEMSDDKLDEFLRRIRKFCPTMLFGYPSALSLIAGHALARGQRMDDLGIEVAFVTSERLYSDQKKVIQSTFGCQVANGYGGRDAGFVAHECPEGGMHVTDEDIVVEIVGESGDVLAAGVSGEVVVTHLSTTDFPFIRYRTGDIAVWNPFGCNCGRGLSLLTEIQGRATDFVVASDGTVMHGLALIYVVREVAGVERFKIIQESISKTSVLLKATSEFDYSNVEVIRKKVQQRLGMDVFVDVRLLRNIPPEKSGKFRYVVSEVVAPTAEQGGVRDGSA